MGPECPGNLQTAVLREIPAVDPLHVAAAAARKIVIWFWGPIPACPFLLAFISNQMSLNIIDSYISFKIVVMKS